MRAWTRLAAMCWESPAEAFVIVAMTAGILSVLYVGWLHERYAFDTCMVAIQDARYCGISNPWGVH